MILYHSVTMYQVLEAIVHRERVHQGEYSVLLLADFILQRLCCWSMFLMAIIRSPPADIRHFGGSSTESAI